MPTIVKEYYHDIDLNKNQLLNSRIHNVTTAQRITLGGTLSSLDKGFIVYDTDLLSSYEWNGSVWISSSIGISSINGISDPAQFLQTDTAGNDFSISSLLGGIHKFNLPVASATKTGKLSNTDWITFNNKQNVLTLTTTGSFGSATLISDVLNIPTYTLAGLGGVPTTRTLTINGVAFDLSSDRSWSVGTVTSVGASAGTGISVSVANPTTTPVITITNTQPDQVVTLTAGTDISISGTYPNFTITNTAPTPKETYTLYARSYSGASYTNATLIGSSVLLLLMDGLPRYYTVSSPNPGSEFSFDSTTGTINIGTLFDENDLVIMYKV